MWNTSINYTAIAAISRIQAGIKCSSRCLSAEIFSECYRNRVMSISAARLLVPLLSEMSDVIRTASDEAETSCCCCHQAWPISTSIGAVRYTEDHGQRVHHDQRPSHIYAHHKSAPALPTGPCGSWCSWDHFWSSGPIHTQSLKHLSLDPPRTQSAFLGFNWQGLRNSCFMQVII